MVRDVLLIGRRRLKAGADEQLSAEAMRSPGSLGIGSFPQAWSYLGPEG